MGLNAERQQELTAITSLGLAFARHELESVGAPLIDRRSEDRVLERFRAWLVLQEAGVDDDVLRARYTTNPRYELVVRHVVALADEDQPEEVHESARGTAEEALRRVSGGEPFERVAADLSEEPGAAERGGLLEPGREGSWVDGFWRAASALEQGEHTDIVRTEYGYHVILLEERRIVPFEEVRGQVVREAGDMLGGADDVWSRWGDSVEAEAGREAVRRRALEEAAAVELGLGAADREVATDRWREQATAWAVGLGFRRGWSDSQVKAGALEALTSSGQNVTILRGEIRERAPFLRSAYPVREAQIP